MTECIEYFGLHLHVYHNISTQRPFRHNLPPQNLWIFTKITQYALYSKDALAYKQCLHKVTMLYISYITELMGIILDLQHNASPEHHA